MPASGTSLLLLGGPVLWLLLLAGVIGLALFVERVLYLHRGQIRAVEFVQGVKNILLKGRLVEALTVCEETPGPVASVVKAALLKHEADEARLRFAILEAAQIELPLLERRLGSVAAIAQAAPLLGLFGTVVGAITVFADFQRGGNFVLSSTLAGGVWQALLATAAGLGLGIAAQLAHHFLVGRVRAIARDMEWAASEILQFLTITLRQPAAAAVRSAAGTAPEERPAPGALRP